MKEKKKIKVVWICHFSNKEVQNHLPLSLDLITKIKFLINHIPFKINVDDFAVWVTNGINEMKHFSNNIELHVISPYPYLNVRIYEYKNDGIYYHFFKNEDNEFINVLLNYFYKKQKKYKKNRRLIKHIIERIQPDLIHLIGAENPYYGLSFLDVSYNLPTMVQLQTLMNDPDFERNYPIDKEVYKFRSSCEKLILKKANFICTPVKHFANIIQKDILPYAKILNTVLPLGETIDIYVGEKKYDFVYFAANINKAADYAIEAFILATKKYPHITLDIVGGYSPKYKEQLEQRLKDNGIVSQVIFEGKLPTHNDVLNQIRLSKYALLPLKIDIVSGTIREALANGLPVVTTITPGTPNLNCKRETVMLSPKGDFQAMADNMCKLIENEEYAGMLRKNGEKYIKERVSNSEHIQKWVEAYNAVISNFQDNSPISDNLIFKYNDTQNS